MAARPTLSQIQSLKIRCSTNFMHFGTVNRRIWWLSELWMCWTGVSRALERFGRERNQLQIENVVPLPLSAAYFFSSGSEKLLLIEIFLKLSSPQFFFSKISFLFSLASQENGSLPLQGTTVSCHANSVSSLVVKIDFFSCLYYEFHFETDITFR